MVSTIPFLFSDSPSPKHAKTISGVPYEEDCCRSYSSTRRSTIPINSPNPSGPAKPIEPIRWARGNKGRWPRTRADSGFAGRPLGRKVGPRGEAAIRRSFESSALPKTIQNVGIPLPRVRRRRGGEIDSQNRKAGWLAGSGEGKSSTIKKPSWLPGSLLHFGVPSGG